MKKVSILIPCYNEQENVRPMSEAIVNLFQKTLSKYDYELLFIDNDSQDHTKQILREICAANSKIKAIFNAKNFGQFNSPYMEFFKHRETVRSAWCAIFKIRLN